MALSITVSALADKIRLAADHQGTTQRVTNADLYSLITDSYGRYVAQASGVGWPYWMNAVTGTLNIGRGTNNGYDTSFGLLQPTFGVQVPDAIYKLEIRTNSTEWRDVEPIAFQHSNMLQDAWNPGETGVPRYFFLQDTSNIGILPPSDQAYVYRLWFVSLPATFTTGLETINVGVVGGEWWIVWDVTAVLKARDHMGDEEQSALANREKAWADLQARVHSRNRGLPFKIQDTRRNRRRSRMWL